MHRASAIPLFVLTWCVAWPCAAQDSRLDLRRDQAPRVAPIQTATATPVTPTPEMWFYEQERSRHDDPKTAVRRKAELKAAQRQDRLASLQWYGLSASRPIVSPNPWYGGYADHWGSNSFDPLRWRPIATPLVFPRPSNGSE